MYFTKSKNKKLPKFGFIGINSELSGTSQARLFIINKNKSNSKDCKDTCFTSILTI